MKIRTKNHVSFSREKFPGRVLLLNGMVAQGLSNAARVNGTNDSVKDLLANES